MPKHLSESVAGSITATLEFTTGTCKVSDAGSFKTNVISEYTAATGVTIDSVLLKDGAATGAGKVYFSGNRVGTSVTDPPTAAQLATAFGMAATACSGFVGVLDNNGAGTTVYLGISNGLTWWYVTATKGA